MAREGSIGQRMPTEALSGAALNESLPAEQKVADKGTPLSAGPKRGGSGEFLPAKYERTTAHGPVIIEHR